MLDPLKKVGGRALDVGMFGAGLVQSGVRAVIHRVRPGDEDSEHGDRGSRGSQEGSVDGAAASGGAQSAQPAKKTVSMPREAPRPAPPKRPTPDPYDVDVTTPVGTTGAGPGYNPSTAESDLQQPGTEPLMDPSTTKKIKAETDVLRKAADPNPE